MFYDLELGKDGEIEQIGACSNSGDQSSAFLRTSKDLIRSKLKATTPKI
jgi:hypothetical protein